MPEIPAGRESDDSTWRDRAGESIPAAVCLVAASCAAMATWLAWLYVRRDGWQQRDPALVFAGALYVICAVGLVWLARAGRRPALDDLPVVAPPQLRRAIGEVLRRRPFAAALMSMSLALAVTTGFAVWSRGDLDPTYWDLVALWLFDIALFVTPLFVTSSHSPREWAVMRRPALSSSAREALLFTAGALALRVPLLGSWPDILGGDEGLSGGVARTLVEHVGNPFSTTFAYGNIYHLILAGFVVVLGPTATALRLPNALAGAAAVGVTYLAGRELFGRRVGLIAGALLLASHMHVHMSRTAHGQSFDTLVTAIVVYALARGIRRGRLGWMALAGVGLGLGQFFYVGGRAVDLVAVMFVLLLALLDRPTLRRCWSGMALAAGAAFVTAAPMITWALRRPGDYMTRINATGVVQSGDLAARTAVGASAWQVMLGQFARAITVPLAYPATSFYNAALPMLDLATGTLLVIGVIWALAHLRDWRYLLLLSGLFIAALVLTFGNLAVTSAYRVTGAMPYMVILASAALVTVAETTLAGLRVSRPGRDGVILAAVGLIVGYNLGYTFLVHLPGCAYLGNDLPTAVVSESSQLVADTAPDATILTLTQPAFDFGTFPNSTYLLGRKTRSVGQPVWDAVAGGLSREFIWSVPGGYDPQELADLVGSSPRPVAVIAATGRLEDLDTIEAMLPGGERTVLKRCGEKHLADVYVLR